VTTRGGRGGTTIRDATAARWGDPDDAFGRLDTAPLDVGAVRRRLEARADRSPAATGARLHRAALGLAIVLLAGLGAVVVVALFPGRVPSSQAAPAPGPAADTGWQNLQLEPGWSATGDGARYRVEDGICYLQLHVIGAGGVWPGNTPIGALPATAAPAWNLGFSGVRAGLPFGEVKVFSTGRILVVAPSTAPGGDITVSGAFPVG
jgi:hypothetical protein